MSARHAVVVAGCVLLACERAADAPQDAQPNASPPAARPAVSCVQFTEQGLSFDASNRAELARALGVPQAVEARSVQGFGGAQDSLFVVRYAGLAVSSHKPAGGGELIDEVRVTDSRYLRYPHLGIGAPVDSVVAALGPPATSSDEDLVYACHSSPSRDDPVTFRLQNGRVTAIVFTYYMD